MQFRMIIIQLILISYNRTNKESTIEGTATLTGGPNEAKLSVVFPSVPFGRAAPYWVLDTDYTTYSVVYSCTDLFFINTSKFSMLKMYVVKCVNFFEKFQE